MKNVSQGTIIRTVILVLALLNTALALFGKSPLPIEDAMIENVVVFVFDVAASFAAWWKNNDFTPEACEATGLMRAMKASKKGIANGEDFFDEADDVEDGDQDA